MLCSFLANFGTFRYWLNFYSNYFEWKNRHFLKVPIFARINNKARPFGSMQNTVNGVPIGSGTLAGDLGGITIWTPWSNGNWCDIEGQFWYINFRLTSSKISSKCTRTDWNASDSMMYGVDSDVKWRFMYQNRPSKSHQLPFDQGHCASKWILRGHSDTQKILFFFKTPQNHS